MVYHTQHTHTHTQRERERERDWTVLITLSVFDLVRRLSAAVD